MGFFKNLFSDKTDMLCDRTKEIIERLWEFEEDQDGRDAKSIEFLTNMVLEFNTKSQYKQANKVLKKLLPQVVKDETLAIMFMDRFYGRGVVNNLISPYEAKKDFEDFKQKLFY